MDSMEQFIEEMYWEFDGAVKGYGEYKGHSQTERDAFKMKVRKALKEQHRRIVEDLMNRKP